MFPDRELNVRAASDPQPGDYWQEMLCATYLVVDRIGSVVVYIVPESNTCVWDLTKLYSCDVSEFPSKVRYTCIDGFWTDVMRGKFQHVVRAYRDKYGRCVCP